MRVRRALFVAIAAVVIPIASYSQRPAGGEKAPFELEWRQVADLPDPVGLKGMYAGVSGGQVVLAGGSNFPVPQREGGRKTFHRMIYVRPVNADPGATWTKATGELPGALGEGASVTTRHGIVGVGGHDGAAPVATVFMMTWNPKTRSIVRVTLPDLPEAVTNASAALVQGWIYVAGGEGPAGARGTFWRLNLAAAVAQPARARWEVLPMWPGPPRFGGILVSVTNAAGEGLLWSGGLPGPARSTADYLKDAHVYQLAGGKWAPAAAMPRGAVLGSSVPIDAARILVLGGSDGHDFERMKELGDRYRIPSDVLLYDARADRWSVVGTMPLGAVGAAVVGINDGWLVAGGEFSPGLRTPKVFHLRVRDRNEAPR
jgi:N-acetylneuraminic acid mutarotase